MSENEIIEWAKRVGLEKYISKLSPEVLRKLKNTIDVLSVEEISGIIIDKGSVKIGDSIRYVYQIADLSNNFMIRGPFWLDKNIPVLSAVKLKPTGRRFEVVEIKNIDYHTVMKSIPEITLDQLDDYPEQTLFRVNGIVISVGSIPTKICPNCGRVLKKDATECPICHIAPKLIDRYIIELGEKKTARFFSTIYMPKEIRDEYEKVDITSWIEIVAAKFKRRDTGQIIINSYYVRVIEPAVLQLGAPADVKRKIGETMAPELEITEEESVKSEPRQVPVQAVDERIMQTVTSIKYIIDTFGEFDVSDLKDELSENEINKIVEILKKQGYKYENGKITR